MRLRRRLRWRLIAWNCRRMSHHYQSIQPCRSSLEQQVRSLPPSAVYDSIYIARLSCKAARWHINSAYGTFGLPTYPQRGCKLCTGADYIGEREQGATLARCKWTGQVALILQPAADGEDDIIETETHPGALPSLCCNDALHKVALILSACHEVPCHVRITLLMSMAAF